MQPTCRLLPFSCADGPHNMAADEVLLESCAGSHQGAAAALRFYAWKMPTLSLGYFQPVRDRERDSLLACLPFVRRQTGGHALVHHYELTYCLALPPGLPWQDRQPWLCRMHGIIVAALAKLGASLACSAGTATRFDGLLCFQHHTAGDVLAGQAKVVGSAQRRQHGALMQHGGILLARSPFAPALPGIRELAALELQPSDVETAIVKEFALQTGWAIVPDDWTAAERQRIEDLGEQKYGQGSWNCRR